MTQNIIYLDHAATGFPKPRRVLLEVDRCLKEYCGNAGRSSHMLALSAAEKIYECREAAAEFFGCPSPENIIFTLNTTYAINMLLKGILKKGDHVIISDMEHNAVYRPIYRLAEDGIIEYSIFSTESLRQKQNNTVCQSIASLIRKNTRLVICAHSSNICSLTLPLESIGKLCQRHGILFAVDAAQSAGHMDIDMQRLGIDALCAPSHKGLCGIQGTGILALGKSLTLDTLVEGGNGMFSLEGSMAGELPERMEAGTLPTPAIVGLLEGIKTVRERGCVAIGAHERFLFRELRERLYALDKINVFLPKHEGAVLLFNVRGKDSEQVARLLAADGICTRGGFHCAALAHKTLGTPEGGAVRISFGYDNTLADVDTLYNALKRMPEY